MSIVMNYEAMFGSENELITDKLVPEILPVTIRESIIKKECERAKRDKKWLLIFIVGTKPCFYKFYGSIINAQENKIPYFIVNAGQHYESLLIHGIKEFDYNDRIAVNLSIRGDIAQKSGELIFKISWLGRYLKKKYPEVNCVPVVLGDTIIAGVSPMAWMFSYGKNAIHLEAGLRSMSPLIINKIDKGISIEKFVLEQFTESNWFLMTSEPFPEQYDTFISSAGSKYFFVPLEINKKHLIREGYNEKNVFITGGFIVDALELKLKEKPKKSIFSIYPQLKNGKWIRFDIHRKENLSRKRLHNILSAVKKLVKKGYNINFIEMNATKIAMKEFGVYEDFLKLKKYKNFLYTPIWEEYSNVIEFYNSDKCLVGITDSGGLQEELNMLQKPCLTVRYNTDRPETVFEGKGNILVPPVSDDFMVRMIEYVIKNKNLLSKISNSKRLYGKNAGKNFIEVVKMLMKKRK